MNHILISFFPKGIKAQKVDEFRPYCPLQSLLQNHHQDFGIQVKAHHLTQSTFVSGRLMTDNVVISHEIMNHMNKKKGKLSLMALKIDMAKAYDQVEWRFLGQILKKHGFFDKFIHLIHECVSSPSFSILINGSPFDKFSPQAA